MKHSCHEKVLLVFRPIKEIMDFKIYTVLPNWDAVAREVVQVRERMGHGPFHYSIQPQMELQLNCKHIL